MARARLHDELVSIAQDLLGPCEPNDLPTDIAGWIERATESAVSAVLEPSMSALIQVLESMVAAAPREVISRLDRAVVEQAIGFD